MIKRKRRETEPVDEAPSSETALIEEVATDANNETASTETENDATSSDAAAPAESAAEPEASEA